MKRMKGRLLTALLSLAMVFTMMPMLGQTADVAYAATSYQVTFNTRGGTPATITETVSEGGSVEKPENPQKDGWDFVDWHYESDLSDYVSFPIKDVRDNLTLHGRWRTYFRVETWDLETQQSGGGEVQHDGYNWVLGSTSNPLEGTRKTLKASPFSGYAFVGWTKGTIDSPSTEIFSTEQEISVCVEEPNVCYRAIFENRKPDCTLTLHWSSVDGVDLVEPIKLTVRGGTTYGNALSQLNPEDYGYSTLITTSTDLFQKEGYRSTRFRTPEPITAYEDSESAWDADLSAYYEINANTDIYYLMKKEIDSVSVSIASPICGTATSVPDGGGPYLDQTNPPVFTCSGEQYTLDTTGGAHAAIWVYRDNGGISFQESGSLYNDPFQGTFKGNMNYYAEGWLKAKFGFYFPNNIPVSLSGGTLVYSSASGDDTLLGILMKTNAKHEAEEPVEEVVKEASCTEAGYHSIAVYCKHCGQPISRTMVEDPATGHTWDEGRVTRAATTTAAGIRTYTCTVCQGTKTVSIPKLPKKDNPLSVKGKTATVKGCENGKLKKNKTLAVSKLIRFTKKGKGKMSYTKASGNKKITINKTTGKVTVKKGLKKGTYKVKVKVKAAGNANYKASTVKTVIFKIKVK